MADTAALARDWGSCAVQLRVLGDHLHSVCLLCRQAGKDNAAKSSQQQPLAKRRRMHMQQPANAPKKQLNPYNTQHTRAEYADRYHPLKGVLKACSRQESTALQPIGITYQADDSVLSGVSILTREYPHMSSQLVWHPIGKQLLNEAAMQTVPQNCHANCHVMNISPSQKKKRKKKLSCMAAS